MNSYSILSLIAIFGNLSLVISTLKCQDSQRHCVNNDSYCGDWNERLFIPVGNCPYRQFTAAQARQCLGERTLLFTGDSQIRDLGVAVGLFLQGQTVHEAPDVKFDKRGNLIWENCTKIGYFESWGHKNRRGVNDYNGYLFPKKEILDVHPEWKWQIQVWEIYCNHMIHQGSLRQVLRNEMMSENNATMQLKKIDLAFWSHGLHDWGWWDSPPYGKNYYNTMVRQWKDMRPQVPTPVVWVSLNNNCPDLIHSSLMGGRKGKQYSMVDEVRASKILFSLIKILKSSYYTILPNNFLCVHLVLL